MKCYKRYLSLLFVFVLLFGLFSISVSAKNVSFPQYKVTGRTQAYFFDTYYSKSLTWTPYNNVEEKSVDYLSDTLFSESTNTFTLNHSYYFIPINNEVFIESGEKTTLIMRRLFYKIQLDINGASTFYSAPTQTKLLIYYTDGSTEYVNSNVTFNSTSTSVTFVPKKDVSKFELILLLNVSIGSQKAFRFATALGEHNGDSGCEIVVQQEKEEVSLLKTISTWLSKVKDGIDNVFTSITELPSKIWQFISDGLKSLFVPDDEFIVSFKESIDSMFEEKLGAVYQVINILGDSWDRITANDSQNIISLPETSISLPKGNSFSFGGYDVPIVPNGFEWLATTIKTLVGIVCSILFLNGLRKKYDEFVGG